VIEHFYSWLQQVDWVRLVGAAVVVTLLGAVRALDEATRGRKQVGRASLSSAADARRWSTVLASTGVKNQSPPKTFRFDSLRKLRPFLHWLLFFAAVLLVVVGSQEIYAELNPRGRYEEPEISWVGALLVATGVAVLWFGRPWLSKKARNPSIIRDASGPP
jgi:hypothetical protein